MNTLAKLMLHWAHSTFGPVALNKVERTLRIVEEAVELAQADDCPKEKLHAIIERAYGRPKDTAFKEMGGLLVTVYSRCGLDGWEPEAVLAAEVDRVLSKPREHWAAKHDAKAVDGTVTGMTDLGEVALPDDYVAPAPVTYTPNLNAKERVKGVIEPVRPRLVILESPYAADTDEGVAANVDYARRCIKDSLNRGEAPIASHLLYTQPGILDDRVPAERKLGIDAGLAWRRVAEGSVVYIDRGMSGGMGYGIKAANEQGIPVEYRKIDG